MKKILLFLLVLMLALLVSCGDGTEGGSNNGGDNTDSNSTDRDGKDDNLDDGDTNDSSTDDGFDGEADAPTERLAYALAEDGTGYIVTGIGTVTASDVVIPAEHEGKPVVAVGPSAFESYHDRLTSVVIPDSITRIEPYAFYECKLLTKLIIPDSVTEIGFGALGGCRNLASLTVPFVGESAQGEENTHFGYIFGAATYEENAECVPYLLTDVCVTGGTRIGEYAFMGCRSIEALSLPDGIEDIGFMAFHDFGAEALWEENVLYLGNTLIRAKDAVSGTYEVKAGTRYIAFGAFATYWDHMGGVSCPNLISVILPEGVRVIGEEAFAYCSGLTSVELPASVKRIEAFAFHGCRQLASIRFDGTVAEWNAVEKEENWANTGSTYTVYCTDGTIEG